MKIASLIMALVATAAFTAVGQDGVVQDVKHGAKKAGETIKDGLQTAGEKTKETAKTVARKTTNTVETLGEKTKQTVNGTAENASETTRTTHHKSRRTSGKVKTQTTGEQATNRESDTPAAGPTP